jgi:3-mercaptopyruvate sulfurtransferase SseA
MDKTKPDSIGAVYLSSSLQQSVADSGNSVKHQEGVKMVMKRNYRSVTRLIIAGLLLVMLSGCGSSTTQKGGDDPVPSAPWTGDVSKFPESQLLASAADLLAVINGTNLEEYIIIDTRSAAAYGAGHIPGAINAVWGMFADFNDPPDKATLKPVDDLEDLLGGLGLTRTSKIILYDNTLASWGSAGRLFWMLEYLGCINVRILNGGWDKWNEDGLPAEIGDNTLVPAGFTADLDLFRDVNVDKEFILNRLGDDDFVVVDTRTDEEYNGWILYDEARGGHIPGAVQIPYESYYNGDNSILGYDDLKALFESRGITTDKEVVSYCTAGIRSGFFYFLTRLMGYPRTANYDGSMWDWAAADAGTYPMEKFENYQALVYPGWVDGMLATDNDGKPYVIVETGWGQLGDVYNDGHIPGAVWVNTDEIEYDCFNTRNDWPVDAGDPACWDRSTTVEEDAAKGISPDDTLPRNWWNIYPDEYLLPAIAYMGIDKNTTVVVYGDSTSAAARILWTLMYAGVADVRFLNGGKDAWTAAGYELETTANERTPVGYFDPDDTGRTTAMHPEYKVDIPFVRNVVNGLETGALLVDIRSWDEYIGAGRPYSYIPTDGRIPGAIYGTDDFTDDDGTLRPMSDILPFWVSRGITPDRHSSFYCGTAWRSSLAWFYAYLMGYPNISNFDSSWFEWSMGEGSAYNGDDPVLNPIIDESPDLP